MSKELLQPLEDAAEILANSLGIGEAKEPFCDGYVRGALDILKLVADGKIRCVDGRASFDPNCVTEAALKEALRRKH